jgi:A/G-specific adenine glycosylase
MIQPAFHRTLGAWFREHGRDLPWRRTRDPYAVLVSEFMLQQTTVAAVLPYFRRWMKAFPDVGSLARATERDVLDHWQGLGYYSRGRNLLRAARVVVEEFGGAIPRDLDGLRRLPGVGPYTAAAVMAFAFDECVPVLDANIIRVIARLANFKNPVTTADGRRFIESRARSLLPDSGGRDFTSAIMDLGATVCTAGIPACGSCPVRKFCAADSPGEIPLKSVRKPSVQEHDTRGLAVRRGKVFLVPSPGPRWVGLWLLPPAEPGPEPLLTLRFTVTRHRIRMDVVRARPPDSATAFPVGSLPPMPTAHRVALDRLARRS